MADSSDDEGYDFSIHDLDQAPDLPYQFSSGASSTTSPPPYRRRTVSTDNNAFLHNSISSQSSGSRPRFWSANNLSEIDTLPPPPPQSPDRRPSVVPHYRERLHHSAVTRRQKLLDFSRKSMSKLGLTLHSNNDDGDSSSLDGPRRIEEQNLDEEEPPPRKGTRFEMDDTNEERKSDEEKNEEAKDKTRPEPVSVEGETDISKALQLLSPLSDTSFDEHAHGPDEEDYDDDDLEWGQQYFCGIPLPPFVAKLTWHRVAAFVATRAPCFWFVTFRHKTDRAVLERLNILCAVAAAVQIASSLWLNITLVARESDKASDGNSASLDVENAGEGGSTFEFFASIWNINGHIVLQGFLAVFIFLAAIVTVPIVRSVNLLGAIRYLWALLWITPFEIYNVIGLFDYFRVTDVWIKHWWRDGTLARFRRFFCEPQETADTLCAAPLVDNVTDWCVLNFNSTDCYAIRKAAQDDMQSFMLAYYYVNASWGLVLIVLLLLVVNTLESIISRPLVRKARQSNVPAWFSLPTIGCVVVGSIYEFSDSSVLSERSGNEAFFWVGPLYIITGGLFFVAAGLGWFINSYSIMNTRDKRYKLFAVYLFIIITGGIFGMLVAIFARSITFSVNFVDDSPVGAGARGKIACVIDRARTCGNCVGPDEEKCIEWSSNDVDVVLQTQAKSSAALAAIFLLYALSAIRFGFSVRRYILMYQIDFV